MESVFKIVKDVEELGKIAGRRVGRPILYTLGVPTSRREGAPLGVRGLLADLGRLAVAFLVVLAAVFTLVSIAFACNLTIPPM